MQWLLKATISQVSYSSEEQAMSEDETASQEYLSKTLRITMLGRLSKGGQTVSKLPISPESGQGFSRQVNTLMLSLTSMVTTYKI